MYTIKLTWGPGRIATLLALAAVLSFSAPVSAADKFLAMGTGSRGGTFYPVGEGICELVNAGRLEHGIRCRAYETGAALYNINALNSREMDVGITYANLAQSAFLGTGLFEHLGPNPAVRSIAGLYENIGAIFVRKSSGITSFDQLKGHRINIGNAGAGGRTIADLIWAAAGWQREDFEAVDELSLSGGEAAFCRGEVDVMVQAVAIPSAFFDHVTSRCDGMFINIPPEIVASVLTSSPYLAEGVIPGGTYRHNPSEVNVVVIPVVLVASSLVSPEAIYVLTKAMFSDMERFRRIDPVLARITRDQMIDTGQFLPFHAGTVRYFREIGVPPWKVGDVYEEGHDY